MTHFQSTPYIFRNEIIGYTHIFDCDIEIQTDLLNKIIDHSGCGFNRAKQLIQSINNA